MGKSEKDKYHMILLNVWNLRNKTNKQRERKDINKETDSEL